MCLCNIDRITLCVTSLCEICISHLWIMCCFFHPLLYLYPWHLAWTHLLARESIHIWYILTFGQAISSEIPLKYNGHHASVLVIVWQALAGLPGAAEQLNSRTAGSTGLHSLPSRIVARVGGSRPAAVGTAPSRRPSPRRPLPHRTRRRPAAH